MTRHRDSDQPFAPRAGVFGSATYTYQSQSLGGDIDYGDFHAFGIGYLQLSDAFVLGLRFDVRSRILRRRPDRA